MVVLVLVLLVVLNRLTSAGVSFGCVVWVTVGGQHVQFELTSELKC